MDTSTNFYDDLNQYILERINEFNQIPEKRKDQLREIDRQRKIDDPTYRGAFHQKKKKGSSKRSFEDKFARTKARQKRKKRR